MRALAFQHLGDLDRVIGRRAALEALGEADLAGDRQFLAYVSPLARNTRIASELWAASERLTGVRWDL